MAHGLKITICTAHTNPVTQMLPSLQNWAYNSIMFIIMGIVSIKSIAMRNKTSLSNLVTHQAPGSIVSCFCCSLFFVFFVTDGRTDTTFENNEQQWKGWAWWVNLLFPLCSPGKSACELNEISHSKFALRFIWNCIRFFINKILKSLSAYKMIYYLFSRHRYADLKGKGKIGNDNTKVQKTTGVINDPPGQTTVLAKSSLDLFSSLGKDGRTDSMCEYSDHYRPGLLDH